MEEPRRPRHIWIFDSLKQCVGAGTGHLLNICLALVLSSSSSGNECAWYFMNFTLDTVLGVPMSLLLLKICERTILRNSAKTGAYYNLQTKRIDFRAWVIQTFSWTAIVVFTKAGIAVPLIEYNHELSDAADEAFRPLEKYPKTQLVFVMIVWPALCNSFQFYVIDNFLKRKVRRVSSTISGVDGSTVSAGLADIEDGPDANVNSNSNGSDSYCVNTSAHSSNGDSTTAMSGTDTSCSPDDHEFQEAENYNGGWISLLQGLFRSKPRKSVRQQGEEVPLLPN